MYCDIYRANNLSVWHSTREFVVVLNPDTELLPDSIATLLEHLEHNVDVGIVASKIVLRSDP